ncbi:MAG: NAD(P)/FAD-dependent oxidoreductase [Pirellulaceae bacterium]
MDTDVIIIGGGLAGLSCAVKLAQRGVNFQILEATDRIGGRVRTDNVDGFLLDHGFQVLLTAYPAAQELLDYDALRLNPFEPGALVRDQSRFLSIDDPWRHPSSILSTVTSGVGTLADKFRIGRLRYDVCRGELDDLFDRVQQPTIYRLQSLGFSDHFIDQFLKPWFSGVFLDSDLATSSRVFEFVFRMFSSGDVALPSGGMQAIPRQLADRLPSESICLETTVSTIEGTSVVLTDGTRKSAKEVVVATEGSTAARLLGRPDNIDWQSVLCFYFSADEAP